VSTSVTISESNASKGHGITMDASRRPSLIVLSNRSISRCTHQSRIRGLIAFDYLQCFSRFAPKVWEKLTVWTLLSRRGMDASEFDRLVARARDPHLIPGIYNYCDGRCPKCSFTQRCLTYLDSDELKSESDGARSLADVLGDSLQRTFEMLTEVARREGFGLEAAEHDRLSPDAVEDLDRHRQDPLAVHARDYGQLAWRIAQAVEPIAVARGDDPLVEAVRTIDWFSSKISSKVYRAICGQAEGWEDRDEAQTDFNGSAKIALIGISESLHAWRALMETGRATADGVPARAVTMLEALDAELRARFPRAMEFVRPGFDEPR
jgi:hypothetical protein